MDLAELKAGVADVDVTYKSRTFTVGYRPEAVDEDDLEAIEKFGDKSGLELLRYTVEPIARLVVRWSFTLGDEPLAVDETAIKSVPPRMRVAILEAIMRDFFDSGNVSPSDAGSPPPAASEATVPSTPPSSSTRNGQESLRGISPDSPQPAAV